jgi:putative ABC transport system permease protein
VILTLGQAVGTRDSVLARLEDRGARLVIVRSAQDPPVLDMAMLERLLLLREVDVALALGVPQDAVRPGLAGEAPTAVRVGYGDLSLLGVPPAAPPGWAWASAAGAAEAGLSEGAGTLRFSTGREVVVRQGLTVPSYLAGFEPLVLETAGSADPLTTVEAIVLVVDDAAAVAPVVSLLSPLLSIDDPRAVTVETSRRLAEVGGALEQDLAAYARALVLSVLAVATVVVGSSSYAQARGRRREFGRRRAVGATRGMILWLLVGQSALATAVGGTAGVAAAVASLALQGDPRPAYTFCASVLALITALAVAAAVPGAVLAARRDPVRELRVP